MRLHRKRKRRDVEFDRGLVRDLQCVTRSVLQS
jgi:hypothetical protein